MSIYGAPVCRGSWALGNNCRTCERCIETRPAPPTDTANELVERRVPVPMYIYKLADHEPLDEEGLRWLADQLCSETRVHEERTMSVGWIPAQAAYEFPHLIDTIEAQQAEIARLREALAQIAWLSTNHGGWFEQDEFGEYVKLGGIARAALEGES